MFVMYHAAGQKKVIESALSEDAANVLSAKSNINQVQNVIIAAHPGQRFNVSIEILVFRYLQRFPTCVGFG